MLGNGGAFIIFTVRIIVANWSEEIEQVLFWQIICIA